MTRPSFLTVCLCAIAILSTVFSIHLCEQDKELAALRDQVNTLGKHQENISDTTSHETGGVRISQLPEVNGPLQAEDVLVLNHGKHTSQITLIQLQQYLQTH